MREFFAHYLLAHCVRKDSLGRRSRILNLLAKPLFGDSAPQAIRLFYGDRDEECFRFVKAEATEIGLNKKFDVLALSNTLHPLKGGGERSLFGVLTKLAARGLSVVAVCLGSRQQPYCYQGVVIYHVCDEKTAAEVAASFTPSVVMAQQAWIDLPKRYNLHPNVPHVLMLRDTNDIGPFTPGKEELGLAVNHDFLQSLYAQAALVVANSDYIARQFREHFSMDCDVMHPGIERPNTEELVSTPLRQFITGVVSNERKGRRIAKNLANRFKKNLFLFASKVPTKVGEKAQPNVLKRHNLEPSVMYMATRIMIIPSQWPEPFGRVSVEAMSRGIPVLASKIGGLPEAVCDDEFLVENFTDIDAWCACLGSLLRKDPVNLRNKSLRLAEDYFKRQAIEETRFIEKISALAKL